ncbi:MAG: hypothetical protein NZ484_00185 [Patescibacteria group bacterium]|nr:hypothetical protein [Patescibacteria group bacterium]MCX7589917.1 hypothetical protein [Patescibacteria group bacterium]MDW8279597.1 hypothetical protein [bacterium]
MNQKNKIIVIGLLLLTFIILTIGAILKKSTLSVTGQNTFENNKLILYYGEGCPHCAIVENYLKSNQLKIGLEQKEVYYNQNNQKDLISKAKICNIPQNQIGIPFLWTGQNCIVGDQPIIDYFKKLNQNP